MNLGTEFQYTLAAFIGVMLECIQVCYRKHRLTTAFRHWSLRVLIDIYCLIFAELDSREQIMDQKLFSLITAISLRARHISLFTCVAVDVIFGLREYPSIKCIIDFMSQVILVRFTYDSVSTTNASNFPIKQRYTDVGSFGANPWLWSVNSCILRR